MALVKFVSTTLDRYQSLTKKDAGTLYSLSNGQLYKGDTLVNNVQIVSTFPEAGINHALYINPSNGEIRYYEDNYGYINVTRPFIVEINENSTHNQIASAAAVKNYVDVKQSDYDTKIAVLEDEDERIVGLVSAEGARIAALESWHENFAECSEEDIQRLFA